MAKKTFTMKYLILLFVLMSCQKENTIQGEETNQCGIVTLISFGPQKQPYIKVDYSGTIVKRKVDVFRAIQLNVGDLYCD